jgi:tetratricopeptide (TPR) repeat protein
MEWAVEFVSTNNEENERFLRETLEAKSRADRGQYGEAARILWELLVQVRHLRDPQWECMTMVHMGKVYRALRWKIAVQLFEDAVDLADRIGLDTAKMIALAELGELKCQWGQFKESLDLLESAMGLLAEGDLRGRRFILLDMTVAYEGLNDLEKCESLLNEVVKIDRKIRFDELADDLDHLERIRAARAANGLKTS